MLLYRLLCRYRATKKKVHPPCLVGMYLLSLNQRLADRGLDEELAGAAPGQGWGKDACGRGDAARQARKL